MPKESIEKILEELKAAKELESFGDKKASLEKMINYSKKLEEFPEEMKNDENFVTKCMSTVYLFGKNEKGKMKYFAFSDSLFVKSELYFLITFFGGLTPEEILSENVKNQYETFFKKLKKIVPISMTRTQGFEGAYERILKIARENL